MKKEEFSLVYQQGTGEVLKDNKVIIKFAPNSNIKTATFKDYGFLSVHSIGNWEHRLFFVITPDNKIYQRSTASGVCAFTETTKIFVKRLEKL